jgi:CSLREA domain-containing protein
MRRLHPILPGHAHWPRAGLALLLALAAIALLATVVTAFPTPTPLWLSRKDDDADPGQVGTLAESQAYAQMIGAPDTLTAWQTQFMGGDDEVQAIYYNSGDLGFGRDMHCQRDAATGVVACYVTNYALGPGSPPDASLAAAIRDQTAHDQTLFRAATVAMVFQPGLASNEVKFYVYGADDKRLDAVALDSQGPKFVPQLCLPCHGGNYDPATDSVTGARFLPFDLDAFQFSKTPGFSRIEQEEKFRALNRLVLQTNPTPLTAALIAGWYDGDSLLRPTQKDSFIPAEYGANPTLYQQTVKPYCRTCHVAQTFGLASPDFFAGPGLLSARESVFLAPTRLMTRTMPHAEQVFHNFWSTNAPAQLAANQGWSFQVTHLTDDEPNGCTLDHCTLREAILAANAVAADQPTPIITFASEGVFRLSRQGTDDHAQGGDLDITRGLFMLGAGAGKTIIDGGGIDRVLHNRSRSDVIIQGVTIQGGNVARTGGGGVLNDFGARLTLNNCVVQANEISAGAGSGAGLANLAEATTEINRSAVIGNRSSGGGGGIHNQGVLRLHNSTISWNEATFGGGIFNEQVLSNSPHQLTLINNTITRNIATGSSQNEAQGGGILMLNGQLTLQNNIVAGNLADEGADCHSFSGPAIFSSSGYNLLGESCPANQATDRTWRGPISEVLDPTLTPLTANGLLPHHPLVAGSPAVDAIPFVVEPANPNCTLPTFDQNNAARPVDGDGNGTFACDSGALEYSPTVDLILNSDAQTEFFDGSDWQPAVLAQTHPVWTDALQEAQWVWKSTQVTPDEALNGTGIVTFRRRFTVPSDADEISGIFQVTADNAYQVSLNGIVVGGDGVLDPAGVDGNVHTVETYPFAPRPGDNELIIEVVNYRDDFGRNDPAANPAGLVFLGQLTYTRPTCCAIRGRVTDANGNPMSEVMINNGVGASTITDAWGEYTFFSLASGVYTVTPNLSSFSFSPATRTVSVPPDAGDQDFSGATIPVNRAPLAHSQAVTTTVNTTRSITLSANDPDGDPLTFVIIAQPAHGTVSEPPKLVYTPGAGYTGPDSFTFKVNDGKEDSNMATVTVEIMANPPVNQPPQATGQTVTVVQNQPTAIQLIASDPENDGLTYLIVRNPAHGTLSGGGSNRLYTPNTGFTGPDSFTYKVNDGTQDSNIATVTIQVKRRTGSGALSGQVLFDGQPVANANVDLIDATAQAAVQSANAVNSTAPAEQVRLVTDAAGRFEHDILQGRYVISASAIITGVARRLQSEVTVVADETTFSPLPLHSAIESQRLVVVSGTVTISGAQTVIYGISDAVALLPEAGSQSLKIVRCHGERVQLVIDLLLQLEQDERSILVTGEAQLGRADTCAAAGRQDAARIGVTLPENATNSVGIALSNTTAGGSDSAQIQLVFQNRQLIATAVAPMGLQRGGRLVTPDGAVELVFPPSRTRTPVTVNYTRRTPSAVTPQPCGSGLICHFVQHFALDAYAVDGTAVTQFGEPYSLTVGFSEAFLRAQGIDPATLRPVYHNGNQWVDLFPCAGCEIDRVQGQVRVVADHFTEFALIGEASNEPAQLYLPLVVR